MYHPFKPAPDWYDKHWYSQEAVKFPWRVPAALASLAAVAIAAWLG